MPGVVITGGPGAGKTTLLAELARRGYRTVPESARAIIAERLAAGLTPRPDPQAFAEEIFRRDVEKYERELPRPEWVFFDRGALEALAMIQEACPQRQQEVERLCAKYRFHRVVFALPPWADIYRNDAERDQTFARARDVHDSIVGWYRGCGYELHAVPPMPVTERASHVLRALAARVG